MQEMWVPSLVREDPLEKEMATHSSILARKIPWTEEPGRLQSVGSQRVGHDWAESWSSQARIEEEGDRTQGCFSREHLLHSTDRLAEFRLWTKELLTSQADSWQGYFNWKASCLPSLNQHLYPAE